MNINYNQETMKKINYLLLFVFTLTMSISSCKKDESTSAKVLTTQERNKEIIIASSWKISSQVKYDASVAIQDCEKDDLYTFFADGTFTGNVGSLICNGETNSSGTWIIYADGTGLLTFSTTTMGINIFNSQLVLTDANLDGITNQLFLIPI
jgi:hypothetical protein